MSTITHIIPAIIPRSYEHLAEEIGKVSRAASRVQIDILDGVYTPKASWPYNGTDRTSFDKVVTQEQGLPAWEHVDIEVDLMVARPETCIEEWAQAGATSVIVHLESTEALNDIRTLCDTYEVTLALAIKPLTDIDKLAPYVDYISFVQCMGSQEVGRQGVPLDVRVLDTIRMIHTRWPNLTIGVDIGVSEKTIPSLVDAGATRFAVGSAVFSALDPGEQVQSLESLVVSLIHTAHPTIV
jgi:ribulose-phosphate 3-epimerase